MQIDPVIHVGDILVAICSGLLGLIGWGLRKMYHASMGFLRRVDGYDERIEDTASVVDVHSDVLKKAGWARGIEMKRVSRKRRQTDVIATDEMV